MDAVGVKIPDELNDKDFLSGCQKTLWVTPDTPHSLLENLASLCQRTNRRLGVHLYEASRRLEGGHVVC